MMGQEAAGILEKAQTYADFENEHEPWERTEKHWNLVMGVSIVMEVPQNGWFPRENPI